MRHCKAPRNEVLLNVFVHLIVYSHHARPQLCHCWHVPRHHAKVTRHSWYQSQIYLQVLLVSIVVHCTANRGWVHSEVLASHAEQQGGHSDCTETVMVPVTMTLYKPCLTTATAMLIH